MSLRTLPITLLCAAALTVTATDAHAVDPQPTPWAGTVTFCQGRATLHRDGQAYRVVRGTGVRDGDTFDSGDHGKIAISLENGPAITVGHNTDFQIDQSTHQWKIALHQGQLRIVHDGRSALSVMAGDSQLQVERAIVQVGRQNHQTQLELVAGTTLLESPSEPARRISRPGSFICGDDRTRQVSALAWDIRSENVRLAAAMQTAPVLQRPGTSNPADVTSPALGLNNQAVTPPSTNLPLTDPNVANQRPTPRRLDGQQEEDEDDLDLLSPFAEDQPLANVPPADAPPVDAPPAATRGADPGTQDDDAIRTTTNTFAGSSSLSLGSFFGSTSTAASGAAGNDANQQTFQGMLANGDPFPGSIHLITAEQQYNFDSVKLNPAETTAIFGLSTDPKYFSIGTGTPPVGQVVTNFFTGTNAVPTVVDVPRFDAYVVLLDQYNYPDPVRSPPTIVGITGLTGDPPTSPLVVGATPLLDDRSPTRQLNSGATFALGDFLVEQVTEAGKPPQLRFAIRRSDQDRLIIKDPGGNDALDEVTPNADVEFVDVVDPRFLPQTPLVKAPVSDTFDKTGTGYAQQSLLRRAAFTTLIADQLKDFSGRTGQTRFVVDGKIIDISGYRPTPTP